MRLTEVSLGIGVLLLSQMATAQGVSIPSRPARSGVQPPAPSSALGLSRALVMAQQNNRLVQAARLQIAEASGDLTGASLRLVYNPQLTGVAGPRRLGGVASGTTADVEVGVEQRFEVGGQRGYRIERARADVETVTASAADVQRVVELAVASTFYQTLAAAKRLDLLEENERLARELHAVAERRLDAGEGTPLEVHTARIRLAEVERRTLSARVTFGLNTVRLAELLGLPPGSPLQLEGTLPADETPPPSEMLVERALRSRPDLAAAEHEVAAAQAAIGLADAEARPDIAVGASYGREGRDNIVTAGLRLPLPFFNKNQGARERARAARQRLIAQWAGSRLRIESEVRQALLAYEQGLRALRLYTADVLGAQEESADLLQRAFEAGEVSIQDVIVVQRELLEGREGYLNTGLALALSRAQILAASSLSQAGSLRGDKP